MAPVLAYQFQNCLKVRELNGSGSETVEAPVPLSNRSLIMNLIILLVVGGLIGWVASIIMRTDAQQGVFLNVVVGIVGALLAGFLITPLIGGASIMDGALNIQSILISLVGAVILLAIVNMFRRGTVR
jgi:uncharacterized membrane protein YeaQ/YmgE (transglycosylase-associated protein family)